MCVIFYLAIENLDCLI